MGMPRHVLQQFRACFVLSVKAPILIPRTWSAPPLVLSSMQKLMPVDSIILGVFTFCVPRTRTRSFHRRPQGAVLRSDGPSSSLVIRSVHVRQGCLRSGRLEAGPSFPCYPAHAPVLPRSTPVTCSFTRCRRGGLLARDLSFLAVFKTKIPHCASSMGNRRNCSKKRTRCGPCTL
jgi:hypothetical protein